MKAPYKAPTTRIQSQDYERPRRSALYSPLDGSEMQAETGELQAACNPWHHDDYVERVETEEGTSAGCFNLTGCKLCKVLW